MQEIIVGRDNELPCNLERSNFLGDAISDLPEVLLLSITKYLVQPCLMEFFNLFCCIVFQVTNYEDRDAREYGTVPCTDYQKLIRLGKQGAFDILYWFFF